MNSRFLLFFRFLLLASVISPEALPAQDPSLVGWWRFDETVQGTAVADSSGKGNAATLSGTFVRAVGQVGGAVLFGGGAATGNAASIGFPTGTSARTVSAWVRIVTPISNGVDRTVLDFGNNDTTFASFQLFVSKSGTVGFGNAQTTAALGTTRVDDGAWHHIAGVLPGNNTNPSLYVDGNLENATPPSFFAVTGSSGAFKIGQALQGGNAFQGIIDEVRLYNRALAASEVQTIYTGDGGQSQAAKPVIQSLTFDSNPVAGGSTVGATVTLSLPAPAGGAIVTLASTSTAVTVPQNVIVDAGSLSAPFLILVSSVNSAQAATITASYGGTSAQASLSITPAVPLPSIKSLSLSTLSVIGGTQVTGTVTLTSNAPTGGSLVTLSSNSGSATVPASVLVAAGSTSNTFTFTTGTVTSNQTAVVTASYNGSTGQATLTVLPPGAPPSVTSLSVAPTSITSGATAAGTVTLSSPAPSGGLSVALSASSSIISFPVSLSIPAGATTVTFTVTAGAVNTAQTVILTATLGGTQAQVTLTVQPLALNSQDTSLVAWWTFYETTGTAVSDSSGNNNAGALAGTFIRSSGPIGGAISFGGKSYVGAVKAATNFPIANAARTVSAWIQLPAQVSGTAQILEHNGYNLYVNNGVLESDGSSAGPKGTVRVDDGLWHHVASVYQGGGGNCLLYVDGKLDSSASLPNPNTPTSVSWRIGQSLNGSSSFPGTIADVRVYNRALAASDLQLLASVQGIQNLTFKPVSVKSGSTVTGTVTLFGTASSGGAVVSLASTSSSIKLPANVTVPAGSSTATFTVTALTVNFAVIAAVTASYGQTTSQATITVAPAGTDPTLSGWWRFGEATGAVVADSSGNGNNGTLNGNFSRVTGQVSANAILFGGTAFVSNQKSAVGFPAGSGPRTITAWIKLPNPFTGNGIIFDESHVHWMQVSGGVLQDYLTGITRLDDGNWHHIASVYGGSPGFSQALYVDGQLDQAGNATALGTSNLNWRIGQGVDGSSTFPGAIDDVRYYSRVLSAAEIQEIVTEDGGNLRDVPVGVSQSVNIKQCGPKPAITPIQYGDLVSCSIGAAGEIREFSFQANEGDRIWLNLQRTGGSASQCYQITDPDGVAEPASCLGYDFYQGYVPDLAGGEMLTKTGSYIIQVSGGGNSTFPFALGLKREIPLPREIPQLTFGVSESAFLLTAWDWHYYAVSGKSGDRLSVSVNRSGPGVSHCLTIYSPNGQTAYSRCEPYDFYNGYVPTLSTTLTLDQTGEYVFRVFDADNLNTFAYTIAVNCVGTCSNTKLPPEPQQCTYSLSPLSQLLPAAARGYTLGITAPQGCPWTVVSDSGFLTISTPPNGGGPDTIGYYVPQNTGAAALTAHVTAGGQTATITQLGTAPLLQVTPNPLVFDLQAGSQISSIPLNLFTNLQSLPYKASVTMTSAAGLNWLSVSSTSGTAPSTIAATVNPTVLPPGTFKGSVTISAPTANPDTITIPVSVTVHAAAASVLSVSSTPIVFNLAVGGVSSVVQLDVSNAGAGFLSYTAAVDPAVPATWLSVSPSAGSVSAGTPASLLITASPGALASGTYSSAIIVSGNSQSIRVPVTMTVAAAGAEILISQVGLSFVGVSGGGNPSSQTLGILNSGVGTLHWTAAASTKSGGNWLSLDSTSGTINRPYLDVSPVTVSVNTSALAPGDYYGKIIISGDAINSGQLITVVLSVLPAGSNPGPEVRPSGLIFVGSPGASPAAQPVAITNLDSQTVDFTSTALTYDGTSWLSQAPAKVSVVPNTPGTLTVRSDNSKLATGIVRGVVTLLFQDGTSTNVNVLNVVAPPGSTPDIDGQRIHPLASGCSSPTLYVQFLSFKTGFQAALGKPSTVSVKVVDSCGNPLVSGSAGTPVAASFSNGDPKIALVSEGGGQWSGTWTPTQLPSAGTSVTVTVNAAYLNLGSQNTLQTGTGQVTGTLISGNTPTSKSVANLATLTPSGLVGAGSLITISGSNFANQDGAAATPPFPTTIGATQVQLGGTPLPLLYSSSGAINALVPYDISPNTQQQLVVSNGGALSVPVLFTVAPSQPGIFSQDLSGTGQGMIIDSGTLRYAEPDTATHKGSTVVIYCTGLGPVSPSVQPGDPAPYPSPSTVNPVSVSIGGQDAQVQFAGLTPGSAGVYQVYATVPGGVSVGSAVPVTISVAGQTSNTVTMAIQ